MQSFTYAFTRSSGNRKLWGIPVTTTGRQTCPDNCRLKKNGCYADQFPLSMHWNRLTEGEGLSFLDMCKCIQQLPKFQLWRWAQAGDLPGDGTLIDHGAVEYLIEANKGKNGFGYTHYDPTLPRNKEAIKRANECGFTLNMSAETLEQADTYYDLYVGPVVVVLPKGQTENVETPDGRLVTVCPASKIDTTCSQCAICANSERSAIVGFPAHGNGAAKAEAIYFSTKEST
jgi:hypothetical protein